MKPDSTDPKWQVPLHPTPLAHLWFTSCQPRGSSFCSSEYQVHFSTTPCFFSPLSLKSSSLVSMWPVSSYHSGLDSSLSLEALLTTESECILCDQHCLPYVVFIVPGTMLDTFRIHCLEVNEGQTKRMNEPDVLSPHGGQQTRGTVHVFKWHYKIENDAQHHHLTNKSKYI